MEIYMTLSNIQYDEIMRHYGRVQNKNRRIHERRIEEVYNRIPQYKEYEAQIRDISVGRARALVNGCEASLNDYKRQMKELMEEEKELLKGAGFEPDYLDDIYDCPYCKDTGYINGEKCSCMKKLEIELLYKQSYLADVLERENFDTFNWNYFSEDYIIPEQGGISLKAYMDKLVNVVIKDYIDNFDNKEASSNLLLIGESGVGKSFLIHCIAKRLMDSSHSVVYQTAEQFFEMLSGRILRKDEDCENRYELAYESDLLIIDDLGTELNNSLTNSELFNCINDRLLRRKAVIISTNLMPRDMQDIYSERVASRIVSNYKCIYMYGDDIRRKR